MTSVERGSREGGKKGKGGGRERAIGGRGEDERRRGDRWVDRQREKHEEKRNENLSENAVRNVKRLS